MADYHKKDTSRGKKISDYWPLFALVGISALAGIFLLFQGVSWMSGFMGVFLIIFSTLKIFDLNGFKRGFKMYDVIAKRFPSYSYVYPFLELSLGLLFLSGLFPMTTAVLTVILFSVGVIGVVIALVKKLDIYCPCMGSILKVPLSTVTLSEDILMILMALVMIA